MQKPSEKFRNIFNFEWNADDDTMRGDNNPLYTKRLEPQLLFGRGYRAGIDVREQRKNNSFYEELIAKRAEYTGEDVSTFIQLSKEPIGFKQRDLIAIAETGSGKTAAYMLPMLSYVKTLPPLD